MYVQIIEGCTRDAAAMKRQAAKWNTDVRPGAIGFLGATSGITADGRAITVARFESEQAARANASRPEQSAWWAAMAKHYDGDVSFTESSDVDQFLAGGSNDAGFVQVMKSRGVNRSLIARLDSEFMKFSNLRPDIIGGTRVWTGPDSCVDINYFTSEAAARAGEHQPMPPELQSMMAEFQDVMKNTEFFDFTDPQMM